MNLLYPNAVVQKEVEKTVSNNSLHTLDKVNSPLDNPISSAAKRLFDIVFSLLVISLVFSWLFPIIALIIKFTSKGPVFFKQKRHGKDNKLFYCLKFRTMRVNQEEGAQASKKDPRITPIGRILRKTSIDEFPQFINVLLGDMSVVGPRPHFYEHNFMFAKGVDGFMTRHAVKPGVTGLAQTRGYRGETNTWQAVTGRFKLDLFYIENWTFVLDLKIVFNTFFGMLFGDDQAY